MLTRVVWGLAVLSACGSQAEPLREPQAPTPTPVADAGVDAAPDAGPDAPGDAVPDAVVPDAAIAVTRPPKPKASATPKPDVADVGAPGEAVALVPVAGKITVFDFWAPWCTPCKDVDRELHALAKRFPTKLALRRVNVADLDTPGAERHLVPGGFTLPHLKVFDVTRRRRFEQSSGAGANGVAALIAKVRTLVESTK